MFAFNESRYDDVQVIRYAKKDEHDKVVYKRRFVTNLPPDIPFRARDMYIISRDGDRLDNLAQVFYGNATLWWYIAHANAIGKGSWAIESGKRLRIPYVEYFAVALDDVQMYNRNR